LDDHARRRGAGGRAPGPVRARAHIRVDMEGPDFTSSATHYFAPKVGLVAYRYALRDASSGKPLLDIEANLRLARLAAHA